jgi:glutathione S-transferase
MVFAHEAGLAGRIECVRVLVAASRVNRDVMRANPLGKIPTLVRDDGSVLYDSAVICEYLDSLHAGPRLFPAAGEARWQALRRHALGDNLLDNLVMWRGEVLRPPAQQSPETLQALEAKARSAFDAMEREAAELAATPVSIGHVAIACALGYVDFRFPQLAWRDGRNTLAAWHAAFAARPSMRLTMPVDET